MFACTTQGGTAMGMPDVCLTPAPPLPPIPIPYPNTAMIATANPSTCCKKVFISMMPTVTKKTEIPMSQGDNAGVAGGVVSGMMMGPVKFNKGSAKVKVEGSEVIRMLDLSGHNGSNPNVPVGNVLAPSQTKVMILG